MFLKKINLIKIKKCIFKYINNIFLKRIIDSIEPYL